MIASWFHAFDRDDASPRQGGQDNGTGGSKPNPGHEQARIHGAPVQKRRLPSGLMTSRSRSVAT